MAKNILMTTLSTLRDMNTINYYYTEKKEGDTTSRFFCDGISQLEAGTKYFLSQYDIDKIVVIGSKETIGDHEREAANAANLADVWKEYQREKSSGERSRFSAFSFYKLRISEFLNNENEISKEKSSQYIEDSRKRKIEELTEKAIRATLSLDGEEKLPADVVEQLIEVGSSQTGAMDFLVLLRKKIKENIDLSFEDEESYKVYVSKDADLRQEKIKLDQKGNIFSEYKKIREEIEEDDSLSLLEREYLYVCLREKLENIRQEKEIWALQAEKNALLQENAWLSYQIQNIKTMRARNEENYAKYYIYTLIREESHLRPKKTPEEKNIELVFVPEKTENGHDNINEIVNSFYGVEADFGDVDDINVYIDVQGGSRTSLYVKNAILSILNNQNSSRVRVRQIISTQFNPGKDWGSKIVDETNRYKVNDLVAGMNAFIRYGKVDMLVKYLEEVGIEQDAHMKELIHCMKAIDDAISICDITVLIETIQSLRELSNESKEKLASKDTYVSNVFGILLDGILQDYRSLWKEDQLDILELVQWCTQKGFIQQAMTIIEDKLPAEYMRRIIKVDMKKDGFWWDGSDSDDTKDELRKVAGGVAYEKRKETVLFYSLPKRLWTEVIKVEQIVKIATAYLADIVRDKEDPTKVASDWILWYYRRNKDGYDFETVYEIVKDMHAFREFTFEEFRAQFRHRSIKTPKVWLNDSIDFSELSQRGDINSAVFPLIKAYRNIFLGVEFGENRNAERYVECFKNVISMDVMVKYLCNMFFDQSVALDTLCSIHDSQLCDDSLEEVYQKFTSDRKKVSLTIWKNAICKHLAIVLGKEVTEVKQLLESYYEGVRMKEENSKMQEVFHALTNSIKNEENVKLYCKYHSLVQFLEDNADKTLEEIMMIEESFFYMLTSDFLTPYAVLKDYDFCKTSCASLETDRAYEFKIGKHSYTFEINYEVNCDSDFSEERFRELFGHCIELHLALRRERNNINHANEKSSRIPLSVVKGAINEYTQMVKELFSHSTGTEE